MRSRSLAPKLAGPALLLLVGGRDARADDLPDAAEGLRVDVHAPCSDRAAFLDRLRAESPALRSGAVAPADLEVTVTESAGRASGSLVRRPAGAAPSARDVEGASCEEVIAALALVAALDLEAAPPPVAPAPPPTPPPPPPPPPPLVVPPPAAWSWQVVLGAHASVNTGVADGLLFGAPIFLGLERRPAGLVSPSVRILLEATESGAVPEAVGALRFGWFVGALEASPVRLGSRSLALRPCARLELGALTASPESVSFGHEVARPWVSVDLLARAEWAPARVFFLELEAGGRASPVREELLFLPSATVYTVPAIGALLELGAGAHFL